MAKGGCHCGKINYEMPDETKHVALCHCTDCRRHAGAPVVGWAAVSAAEVKINGTPAVYESSAHGRRHFCRDCGTSLFYVNEEVLPGLIDVQIGTLDDANAMPPAAHIQTAERLTWMKTIGNLPEFERYPDGG